METVSEANFKRNYQTHLKHLKLKGLQPSTIKSYARAINRIGARFNYQIENLSEAQLVDHFSTLIDSYSWNTVKLDLYGLKFYYTHVLHKPWAVSLVKPPRIHRLPDIVTVDEAKRLFLATHVLSYRVFLFTVYSLGLRLGEGLRLQIGDIDAGHQRVHIRNSKGNKDRFVPLPNATVNLLRRFWRVHRNPVLLFPNRRGGPKVAHSANTPLDRAGIRTALQKVVSGCGLKKRSRLTVYAIATQPT